MSAAGVSRRVFVATLVGALGLGFVSAARPAVTAAPGTATTVSPAPHTLPLHAAIVSQSTAGPVLTLMIACRHGLASDVCSGAITLTASGGTEIGSAGYSAASGSQATVTVPLNPTGQTMLSDSVKLAATLTITGTTALTRAVQFHYPEIVASIAEEWTWSAASTTAVRLTVTQVPAGVTVEVLCDGGGCPFASRAFSPRNAQVRLGPSLNRSRLKPGATLEVEVTGHNRVGEVVTYTIRVGSPTSRVQCLPPGATTPSDCA